MNLAGIRERWTATPVPDLPDLRLVGERPGHTSRTYLVVLVLSILFLVLFGLAVFHTVLIGAQGRLDRLDSRISEEEERQHELRREVAELESPARIVDAATDDLGMVPPDEVVWLAPAEPPGGAAADADGGPAAPRERVGAPSGGAEIAAAEDAGGEDR